MGRAVTISSASSGIISFFWQQRAVIDTFVIFQRVTFLILTNCFETKGEQTQSINQV